jgi:thiamine biosynthesis lipoprotein
MIGFNTFAHPHKIMEVLKISGRRETLLLLFIFFIISLAGPLNTTAQQKYVFEKPRMGSPFTITIYSNDSLKAALAAEAAFKKADELNQILSDYIDSSEINRLSVASGQGRYIRVSDPLFDILQHSLEAARLSKGSFDISMGPIVRLWRKARRLKQLPDADSIKAAMQKTGWQYIHIDTVNHSVWLEKPGMQLDIGGLGKGFVAHAALRVLQEYGLPCTMVNAGGKIVTGEAPPGKNGWRIGINIPGEKERIMPYLLLLKNMAVATSGDIYQYLEFNGIRYSHIIDPRTGTGITHSRNVTAIAADATTADWLSTACSILSIHQSFQLIKKIPGAALLIAEKRKNKIIQKQSAGFETYLEK